MEPSHFTKFMKRLRRRLEPKKIRYFMCGEYGELCEACGKSKPTRPTKPYQCHCEQFIPMLGRPHFHALLFGHDFEDKTLWNVRNEIPVYRSESLEKLWYYGQSEIGDVTFESAAYVARYCVKKVNGDGANDHYRAVDSSTGEQFIRHPEFCRMSRGRDKPGGIGGDWYRRFKGDLRKDFITVRGRKMRPPKYYDKQLEREDPFRYDEIKEQRGESQRIADKTDQTPERLAVREHIQLKRAQKLTRGNEYEN